MDPFLKELANRTSFGDSIARRSAAWNCKEIIQQFRNINQYYIFQFILFLFVLRLNSSWSIFLALFFQS